MKDTGASTPINALFKDLAKSKFSDVNLVKEIKDRFIPEWRMIVRSNQQICINQYADASFLSKMDNVGNFKMFNPNDWAFILSYADKLSSSQSEILNYMAKNNPLFEIVINDVIEASPDLESDLMLNLIERASVPELRKWAFYELLNLNGNGSFGQSYLKNDVSVGLSDLLRKNSTKEFVKKLILDVLKNPDPKTIFGFELMCVHTEKKAFVNAMIEANIKSLELYKITKNPEFLPEVMKKIFLIKDEK